MATAPLTSVVQHLQTLARANATDHHSDQQLVQRCTSTADPEAFAALVRRHGPLVHGVCRRVLGAGPDVDDVFQATFVVLLKKVASIRKQASVASWLYGVAYRLAIDVKGQRRRRRAGANLHDVAENQAMHQDPSSHAGLRELSAVLDQELLQLPAWAREALVACHLEGRSYTEAAGHLGWKLGTLKTRLGRARRLLRQRLLRRGVTLSLLGLCVALSERAQAAVPAVLVRSTLRCVSSAGIPQRVAVLAEAAAQALTMSKVHKLVFFLGVICLLGLAGGAWAWQAAPDNDSRDPVTVVQTTITAEPVQQPDAKEKSQDQADTIAEDEQRFRATLKITDQALLDYFRELTPRDADVTRINQLIQQLSAAAYKDREKATAALIAEGPRAVPLLKKAQARAALELRMRLGHCLKAVDKADAGETTGSAARLVKNRRPEGGVQVLLDFLPFVHEEAEEDVLDAFCQLAATGGKVHAQALAALKDSVPGRRAAAALVVGGFGTPEQRAAALPLLKDGDAMVQFRAAQGLLAAREIRAVPALIDMLTMSELSWAYRAESLLQDLAGKNAPTELLAGSSGRDRCQKSWLAWWRLNQDRLSWPAEGLHFVNKDRLARKAANDFIQAILKHDVQMLERSTDLPFFNGDKTFDSRADLNAHFNSEPPEDKFKVRILRVSSIAESSPATRDAERAFLASLQPSSILLVQVVIEESGGPAESVALVVRFRGGRGRVVGVVEIREGK
jgi:RNA polymerase sigma factor (sigma-70 family)